MSEDFQDRSIKAYLPFRKDLEDIRKRINIFLQDLKGIFPEVRYSRPGFRKLEERDWSQNWRRFFHADHVTPNLLIVPAWEPLPSLVDSHIIRIDPGPAFGTGQHPTTRMCLAAMERVRLPESWTMLDVGTGSGILAIYGAMLGARKIVALDIDPDALQWAKWNIRSNGLEGSIELSSQSLEKLGGSFSLLTANLILGEIIDLYPHFCSHLDPGGWLILSGILKEEVNKTKKSFIGNDFDEDQIQLQQDWACVTFKRRG